MRIIDLQRRLREIGRIRIGEQVATGQGTKTRPAKLEVFRLTSRDQTVIEAAAELYGGTPEPWLDAPDAGHWQVKTTSNEFSVIVPPGDMAFSQAYEQWTAGGCKVRCDGEWNHIDDKPCKCDPEARACAIHTRLSVMLPDLPGIGLWRLDTSGYYAAVELGGVVDLAAGYTERGQMIPARLRLEQRSVKRGGKTIRYAVPALDLHINPMALAGGGTPVAIGAGNDGGAARFQPVPAELPSAPVPPVADQVSAIGAGEPKRPRSNAAQPIPATGVAPRAAADATDDLAPPSIPNSAGAKKAVAKKAPAKKAAAASVPAPADDGAQAALQSGIDKLTDQQREVLTDWWKREKVPSLTRRQLTAADVEKVTVKLTQFGEPLDEAEPAVPTAASGRNKKMHAMVAEAWPGEDQAGREKRRKGLIKILTTGRSESSKDLTAEGWDDLFQTLEDVTEGRFELFLRSGGDYELRPTTGSAA